ncbi:MAG: efflux RND transporter periplasmic adaptor subunit [Gemmatimonadaceae bacterium]|jgi:RND family efflux transporter MFP subunit|nr:efflux RND transporter periplasmic adaptor subunit [Gemmatimonadaceae bacterium]
MSRIHALTLGVTLAAVAACTRTPEPPRPDAAPSAPPAPTGTRYIVGDTLVTRALAAAGTAEPITQATLSSKLMGTVVAVLVQEGDRVRAGQPLLRLDARDLAARREQVIASIASAEAAEREATLQATRMRALVADSAAPRAQLDAVEAGLARAQAGARMARASAAELAAMTDYAVIRAPFDGIVTHRMVDPGAFAAPGAPLVTVQDSRRLRVVATVAPALATTVQRGRTIEVTIEGVTTSARVEAVVPAPGNLYQVNAIVDNRDGRLAVGGAASLGVPQGTQRAILVPEAAIRREGDLTGVTVEQGGRADVRWVRLGPTYGRSVEVLSGLRAGDTLRVLARAGGE